MITKNYTYRKCGSEKIVKNGKNVCGNQQYRCKECGSSGVLEPQVKYVEERKEEIIRACQERSSMSGIQRTYGVSIPTLSKRLKKSTANSRK